MANWQQTIKRPVLVQGVGLHSGEPVSLRILPANPDQGITFVRTDLKGRPEIPAHFSEVTRTSRATTLGRGKSALSTVEHVMAALYGMGIDNAIVEIDGPEVPVMDGSAKEFCLAIHEGGVQTQLKARKKLILRKKVEVRVAEKWAVAEPHSGYEVQGSIDWDHPAIGYQEFRFVEGETDFNEIMSARTFGFLKEVETLKKMGLARGGSLENVVVLDDARVMNPDGLRYRDEFVRHKVLDALGDFMLAQAAIQAKIRLHRAGHELHYRLLEAIFADPANYELISSETEAEKDDRLPLTVVARGTVPVY